MQGDMKKTIERFLIFVAVFLLTSVLSSCAMAEKEKEQLEVLHTEVITAENPAPQQNMALQQTGLLPKRNTGERVVRKDPDIPILSYPEERVTTFTYKVSSKYCEEPFTAYIPVRLYNNGSFRQIDAVLNPYIVPLHADQWQVESVMITVLPADGKEHPTTSLEYRIDGNLYHLNEESNEMIRIGFYEGGRMDLYP